MMDHLPVPHGFCGGKRHCGPQAARFLFSYARKSFDI
jgi:hypothetical protein